VGINLKHEYERIVMDKIDEYWFALWLSPNAGTEFLLQKLPVPCMRKMYGCFDIVCVKLDGFCKEKNI